MYYFSFAWDVAVGLSLSACFKEQCLRPCFMFDPYQREIRCVQWKAWVDESGCVLLARNLVLLIHGLHDL